MKSSLPFRSVLIFGGAGFIGSNWARRLLTTTDASVHIFDNLSRSGVQHNLRSIEEMPESKSRLKVTVGDVRNADAVRKAVKSATEIYHFAAQVAVTTSVQDPRQDFEINALGTLNVLEAARQTTHKPFLLFTSTNKVYGHMSSHGIKALTTRYSFANADCISEAQPLDFYSPYGCSKGTADQYVRDYSRIYGLPTVVFRMSCIAGPHQFGNEDQGWVAHFLYSALEGKPVSIYGDGLQVRDVLAVQDLMRAFEAVRENLDSTRGQVFNVGGGPGNTISLLELIEEIAELTGEKLRYRFHPTRPGDQPVYVTDFTKLRKMTGWHPTMSVMDTVKSIYRWWEEHQNILVPQTTGVMPGPVALDHSPEVAS